MDPGVKSHLPGISIIKMWGEVGKLYRSTPYSSPDGSYCLADLKCNAKIPGKLDTEHLRPHVIPLGVTSLVNSCLLS